jgi:plastocyanin
MKELRFQNGPLSLLLAGALALCAVACGDDSDDGDGAGASGSGASGSGGAGGGASGSGASGGEPADIPDFNGCTNGDYVDLSGASADRTITIAAGGMLAYAPKCAIIAAGQSVTFSGSLSSHPTAPGNADDPDAGEYDGTSPIVLTDTGMSAEFTFPNAGTYPYYCTVHGFGAGDGMSAVIHVK